MATRIDALDWSDRQNAVRLDEIEERLHPTDRRRAPDARRVARRITL